MTDKPKSRLGKQLIRFFPLVVGSLITVGAGGAAVYFVIGFMEKPITPPKNTIQEVRLIRPPPPPPPEEIEPPPPPEMEEEVDLPEPEAPPEPAMDDLPPPGELLGLDADGVAGSNDFGLVARRGGRDLLASGSGSRFNWYAGVLKDDLLSFLSDYEALRSRAYEVELSLWLEDDGTISRIDLNSTTGVFELDEELRARLAGLSKVGEAPPSDLPQPIQIRIVSRI